MQAFSDAYLDPFVNHIQESTDKSLTHVKSETERLKKYLKEKLAEIDDLLKQKLSDLKNKQSESQLKQEEVAKKEADLKWLLKMEQSINEIINF
jgi:flagellar hook-basal body complex protein FliE